MVLAERSPTILEVSNLFWTEEQRKAMAQMGRRHYNSNKHVSLQLLHTRSEPSRLEVPHQNGHKYSVMSRVTTTTNDVMQKFHLVFLSNNTFVMCIHVI